MFYIYRNASAGRASADNFATLSDAGNANQQLFECHFYAPLFNKFTPNL
jgi:hypothetical protein